MTDSPAVVRGAARLFAAFLAAVLLGSCGSGAVSPQVNDPNAITVMPNTATLYSGLPTTFVITGGTGQYVVSSSNQATVQVSGPISGNSLVVVPNYVTTDTSVTLTIRDTGATTPVSATLTVKPNPVSNNVTVTASGTQGGACAPAVCSGGDALVTATVSQGGIPLSARGVRLSVVSGDFAFIVNDASGQHLANTIDVVSDELGKVQARLQAFADAPNQTAIVQVTDLGTLAFQRASFLISQATGSSPGFIVTPTSIEFSGAFTGQCANNTGAVVYVFGGVPPYQIANTNPDAFGVSDDFLANSGDNFAIRTLGKCASNFPIVVRDSAGHTATVTVSNVEGATAPTPVVVAPDDVTLTSCTDSASSTISGGDGTYFVSAGSSALAVSLSGNTVTVTRRRTSVLVNSALPDPTDVSVGVSDGHTSTTITVHLVGEGATGPNPPATGCH